MKSGHLLVQTLRKIAASGTNIVLVTHHIEEKSSPRFSG